MVLSGLPPQHRASNAVQVRLLPAHLLWVPPVVPLPTPPRPIPARGSPFPLPPAPGSGGQAPGITRRKGLGQEREPGNHGGGNCPLSTLQGRPVQPPCPRANTAPTPTHRRCLGTTVPHHQRHRVDRLPLPAASQEQTSGPRPQWGQGATLAGQPQPCRGPQAPTPGPVSLGNYEVWHPLGHSQEAGGGHDGPGAGQAQGPGGHWPVSTVHKQGSCDLRTCSHPATGRSRRTETASEAGPALPRGMGQAARGPSSHWEAAITC